MPTASRRVADASDAFVIVIGDVVDSSAKTVVWISATADNIPNVEATIIVCHFMPAK